MPDLDGQGRVALEAAMHEWSEDPLHRDGISGFEAGWRAALDAREDTEQPELMPPTPDPTSTGTIGIERSWPDDTVQEAQDG